MISGKRLGAVLLLRWLVIVGDMVEYAVVLSGCLATIQGSYRRERGECSVFFLRAPRVLRLDSMLLAP